MAQMGTTEMQATDIYDALWQLVWQGYVTADSWIAVRGLLTTLGATRSRPARILRTRFGQRVSPGALPARRPAVNSLAGRGSRVNRQEIAPARLALSLVENLLDRYGVITRGSVMSEPIPGGFPALQPVLRSMEDAGRLLRGRFVAGSGGAQFADHQTIERLRVLTENKEATESVAMAALDPANPFGAMLSWPVHASGIRPTRRLGGRAVIAGGALMLFLTPAGKELLTFSDDLAQLETAVAALGVALKREKPASFTLETVDGEAVSQSPLLNALREAGFSRVPQGFSWYS
jgi:ATP-dependent Lhr-like helicase